MRTDAQAFYVFDISRSMLAASGIDQPTRLDRAERIALRVRSGLEGVSSGIATLTDRVLPDLFPTSDDEVFTATIEQSVGVDQPPPRGVDLVTTLFAAFDTMAGDNFFDPGVKKRVVVFFTDGESAPYDREALRQVFRPRETAPDDAGVGSLGGDQPVQPRKSVRTHFVVMRIGNPREKVYFRGKPVDLYKGDPQSAKITQDFAEAVGGTVVADGDVDGMVAAARTALGDGPLQDSGRTLRVVPLARWFLLAALVPLVGLLWRRNLV